METNKIYNGDCFDLIKELPDNFIDMVLTSPPYADIKSYGDDINVLHPDNYVDWILPLFDEFYRVLKPTGSIIFNIGDKIYNKERHIYVFDLICRISRETQLQYYDRYFWYSQRLPNGSRKRLNNFIEYIFHFTKNKNDMIFNMDDVREPYKDISVKRYNNLMNDYEILPDGTKILKKQSIKTLNPKGKTPDGLFTFPSNSKERGNKHPAPFSIDLPLWFIKALTNVNDIVLDPFMGSGTTARACAKLNRRYIGFELNDEYIKISDELMLKYKNPMEDVFF